MNARAHCSVLINFQTNYKTAVAFHQVGCCVTSVRVRAWTHTCWCKASVWSPGAFGKRERLTAVAWTAHGAVQTCRAYRNSGGRIFTILSISGCNSNGAELTSQPSQRSARRLARLAPRSAVPRVACFNMAAGLLANHSRVFRDYRGVLFFTIVVVSGTITGCWYVTEKAHCDWPVAPRPYCYDRKSSCEKNKNASGIWSVGQSRRRRLRIYVYDWYCQL